MGSAKPRNDRNELLKTIGANVRRLRKDRGWSQERLANEADMDRTYIGYVENAKYNVTIGALCALANALKVDVGSLLYKDGN